VASGRTPCARAVAVGAAAHAPRARSGGRRGGAGGSRTRTRGPSGREPRAGRLGARAGRLGADRGQAAIKRIHTGPTARVSKSQIPVEGWSGADPMRVDSRWPCRCRSWRTRVTPARAAAGPGAAYSGGSGCRGAAPVLSEAAVQARTALH
jgi:hypothetical protein